MKFETLAIHGGHEPDAGSGAVAKPITLSVTYQRESDGTYPKGSFYSSKGNPNRNTLEACFAGLEGGHTAVAFSSGCAAIAAVIRTLKPGNHVLIPDDVFQGTVRILRDVMPKWGVTYRMIDMTDLTALTEALTPDTKLVWTETFSNPLLKVTNLGAVATIARKAGALCVVDNTFVTPALQRPLDCGVDLVVHASTKYIGGHGDVLGGIVVSKENSTAIQDIRQTQMLEGAVPSPFDCWLTHRGLKTLPYRVRAHSSNAMAVAQYLSDHRMVKKVFYPGLESHEGHELAASELHSGFGGIVSLQVRGGRDAAVRAAGYVKVFINATSFGEVESLIQHQATSPTHGSGTGIHDDLLRLSVGLEHPDDLIADLDQALTRANESERAIKSETRYHGS